MPNIPEQIKSPRLSALAQLIAIHMASGMTKTADLAAQTGYTSRAIRKAKSELESGTIVPEPQFRAEPQFRNPSSACGTIVPKSGTPVPPSHAGARAYIASHANNESPTEIVYSNSTSTAREALDELDQLNGSAGFFIKKLARGMAGPDVSGGVPDFELAKNMLRSSIRTHGAKQVDLGMQSLIAQGHNNPSMNWAKAYPAYMLNAKTEPIQTNTKPQSHADRERERMAEVDRAIQALEVSNG